MWDIGELFTNWFFDYLLNAVDLWFCLYCETAAQAKLHTSKFLWTSLKIGKMKIIEIFLTTVSEIRLKLEITEFQNL